MPTPPDDFEQEMKHLSSEAQLGLHSKASKEPKAAEPALGIQQMLKPLVLGIEALSRATAANTQALTRLEELASAQAGLPELMATLHTELEQRSGLNQTMFNAFHEEFKTHRDAFLFEALQKPIVRELITIFDDLSEIHRQMLAASASEEGRFCELAESVGHIAEALVEAMARFEVKQLPASKGKLDKHKHRAVALEVAETPAADGDIVATVKPAFVWRDRILRPEEVIIRKYKDGYLMAMEPSL